VGSSSVSPQPVGTSPEDQLPSSIPTSQNQNSPSVLNDEVLSDVIPPTPSTTTRTRPRVNYQTLHRYGSVFSVLKLPSYMERSKKIFTSMHQKVQAMNLVLF
jgi:hypothetical protein